MWTCSSRRTTVDRAAIARKSSATASLDWSLCLTDRFNTTLSLWPAPTLSTLPASCSRRLRCREMRKVVTTEEGREHLLESVAGLSALGQLTQESGHAGPCALAPPRWHSWQGVPHPDSVHKGTVLQRPDPGRIFKGLGVAKRYCRRKVIGNTVLQLA